MPQNNLPVYTFKWSTNKEEDRFIVETPVTGQPIAVVQGCGVEEVDRAVKAAHEAYSKNWRWVAPHDRADCLLAAADIIKKHSKELSELETYEEGKPIFASRGDVKKAAEAFEFFGGLIGNVPTDFMDLGAYYAAMHLEPYGVIAGVLPFNWPPLHAAAKSAPALAVGNSVVLKPSKQAPLTVIRMIELIKGCFPEDTLSVVSGPGRDTTNALVSHPLVRKVSFTGSTAGGKAILRQTVDTLTPSMMELGGKNPMLILADADLDKVVPAAFDGVFYNNGQACTAVSRILVHRSLHDEFVRRFSEKVEKIRVGNGADENTQIGPLVSKDQQRRVLDYIEMGVKEGARIAAQAKIPENPEFKNGYFVPPTLFCDVTLDMQIARDELFGPVTCVIPFDDVEEGVNMANDTEYGLVAVVFTENQDAGQRIARQLDAGTVYINNFCRFGRDVIPFGGNKASGFGRERCVETLHEYGHVKAVRYLSGIGSFKMWGQE